MNSALRSAWRQSLSSDGHTRPTNPKLVWGIAVVMGAPGVIVKGLYVILMRPADKTAQRTGRYSKRCLSMSYCRGRTDPHADLELAGESAGGEGMVEGSEPSEVLRNLVMNAHRFTDQSRKLDAF